MSSRQDAPLSVQVPRAGDDRPAWGKVSAIAVVGFLVGIGWPHLAGVRLGPSAPADAVASTPAAHAAETSSAVVSAATIASAAPVTPAPSAAASVVASAVPVVSSGPPVITVPRGSIVSCKTSDGATLKGATACGTLNGFDAIATPRIKRLGNCSGADGQTGKLSVVLIVDFDANKVGVDIGHSSTLQNLDTLAGCLRTSLDKVSLGAIEHDNPRYTLYYNANFAPREAGSAGAAATTVASAQADSPLSQVVWDVAIVRDTPRTGQVVARLQRGTKIKIGGGQEGWYRVKFGADYTNEGWVYRGAIGK